MQKRLKYAKLRLPSAGALLVATEEQKGSGNVDTGENSMASCKKSKFFTTECSSQNTFVEIDDEQADEHNKESNVQASRRRTVSEHEVCSGDGPQMPKLRKKISNGSGVIRDFLNTNKPEDDDFEETRHNNVSQPKQTKVQRALKKPKAPKKPKNQSDIRKLFKKYKSDYDVLHKLIEDHSVAEQIDPEQLQMALAMSRSLVDQECSENASAIAALHTDSGSCSISSEERRIVGIRTTLEQFGFRCKNSYTDYDLNVIFGAGCKNVKKIKHKRATNLQCRTRNELDDFIDRKTKSIFPVKMVPRCSETSVLNSSETSQSYLSNLFWMAQTGQASKTLFSKYYVPELIEVNSAPAGCLLKDWSKIPGREKSPERNTCATTGPNLSLPHDQSLEGCARATSPDLFDELDDSVSNAHFSHDATGRSNQFERKENGKTTENECLVDNGQLLMEDPVNHSRDALVGPSEEPNSVETLAETKSVRNTQVGESAAALKELQEKQVMNETEVENCTNAKIQQANVIDHSTVGNVDDKSSVLDSPGALDRSTENMFDETDIDPIVSFEVYSSEEEKISSHAAQMDRSTLSQEDINPASEPAFAPIRSEHSCNKQQPFNACISKEIAEPPKDTTSSVNTGPCGLQLLRGEEKELSFNRIAVKARVNEALQNSAFGVETVDLIESTASAHETSEDEVVNARKSNCPEVLRLSLANESNDDCIYISDDDVNDSIREPAPLPVDTVEDDLNRTEIYDCLEPRTHSKLDENEVSVLSYCHQSLENERLLVRSVEESKSPFENESESCADKSTVKCANNTFAYLESLIKQYDLPPLQLRSTSKSDSVNSNILENSKSNSPPPTTKSVDKFAQDKFVCSSSLSEDVSNVLEKYHVPYFNEKTIETEKIVSKEQTDIEWRRLQQDSSSKLCSTDTSCCQLISPKKLSNCTNIMASDSGAPSRSEDTKANRFESKFHELKTLGSPKVIPEYLISVKHTGFEPPSFEHMSTSEIERELFKYGLKDLKRSKAIQVLNHLFEKTHMFVDVQEIG